MFVEPAECDPGLFETSSFKSAKYVTIKYSKNPIENPSKFNHYNISDDPIVGSNFYKVFSILNTRKKYLISIASNAISNNIQQDIPSIVAYSKKYPDMLAVIYKPEYNGMELALSKFLTKKNIDYIFVPYETCLHINNFFIVESFQSTLASMKDSLEFIESAIDIVKKESNPHKKVYVSRKKTRKKYHSIKNGKPPILMDGRIDNEEILENFFKDHNFEIVYPEDFTSIQEQISFFRDVKILVSLSGGGMTNHMFMQNNQTVVELATHIKPGYVPGISKEDTRAYHMEYIVMSYTKKHTYIVMPHDETAAYILDKFTKNEALSGLLN